MIIIHLLLFINNVLKTYMFNILPVRYISGVLNLSIFEVVL